MKAKFDFDGVAVIDMISQCLRRKFGSSIEVDGYVEDGSAVVTVQFPDGDTAYLETAKAYGLTPTAK